MKRYIGRHEMLKKGPDREAVMLVTIIFVTVFCLFCSLGLLFNPVYASEPQNLAQEAVCDEIPIIIFTPENPSERKIEPLRAIVEKDIIPIPDDQEWHQMQEKVTKQEIKEETEAPKVLTDKHIEYYKAMVNIDDAIRMAKALSGEYNLDCGRANGHDEQTVYNQAAGVVWSFWNRYDAGYGTMSQIITHSQYLGYNDRNDYTDEMFDIVMDVSARWWAEQDGWEGNSGRVLPKDYLWFGGNHPDHCNWFRNKYQGNYQIWDWSEVF